MAASPDYADHFGIDNIPFGVGSSKAHSSPQCVSRYENKVIFLADVANELPGLGFSTDIFSQTTLNAFAALGQEAQQKVRAGLQKLIKDDALPANSTEDVSAVQMHLPVFIGDFTDFSCSPHHNRNAGQALLGMSRGLPPGYLHMPLGYAGRCSSISVSGTPVRRPMGQYFEHGHDGLQGKRKEVIYGPCRNMDYELEMAAIVGQPVPYGQYVKASEARTNVFGFVLLNDWSARDVQQLEMIPVGPLNSKHAATTISPWVITPDALAPFAVPARKKESPLAPHLANADGKALAVQVEVSVDSKTLGRTSTEVMDWTFEQLVAHQSSAGCGLRTGDLLGIGTISGPGDEEQGCLLEQFLPGKQPRRGYLQDGEEVRLTGYCGTGVGFGECKAKLVPALDAATWRSA